MWLSCVSLAGGRMESWLSALGIAKSGFQMRRHRVESIADDFAHLFPSVRFGSCPPTCTSGPRSMHALSTANTPSAVEKPQTARLHDERGICGPQQVLVNHLLLWMSRKWNRQSAPFEGMMCKVVPGATGSCSRSCTSCCSRGQWLHAPFCLPGSCTISRHYSPHGP